MDWLTEPLSYPFIQHALIAGVAVGAVCAIIGVFIVQRGLSFLGDGLAHAAFGGIAIGLYFGGSPESATWLALPFTVVVALGIGFILRRGSMRGDVATGVFFAFSFALGVLFLGLRSAKPGARPVNLESLLFGSILAITPDILYSVLAVTAIAFIIMLLAWSRLAYATFDPELAKLSGVPVALLDYTLLGVTAVVIVVAVKTAGVVLVSSFIVIPAATARLIGRTLGAVAILAVAIGTIGAAAGLLASYHLNVASGATIILTLSLGFSVALVAARKR